MAIVYSKGFQQSIYNDGSNNSKPVIHEIEWDADYKNDKGKMNVDINKNGKKNKYQLQLNKNDLEKILQMPSINQSLDQRLIRDFPVLEADEHELQSIPQSSLLPVPRSFSPSLLQPESKYKNITRKNMKGIPKSNIKTTRTINNEYDELEDLFMLRKKLMTPYHLTHTVQKNKNKTRIRKRGRKTKTTEKSKKSNSFLRSFTDMF
jgi:hypothetical protein